MIGTLKLLYQRSTALFRPPFEPSLGTCSIIVVELYLDVIWCSTSVDLPHVYDNVALSSSLY